METKEGEIFEYNGEWYQCIVENGCENCAFNKRKCYTIIDECGADRRKDNKNVIFKKLEKVGEPYIEHDHSMNKDVVVQDYKLYNQHACYNGHEKILCFGLFDKDGIVTIKSKEPIKSLNCKNSVEIEIKQNKEDMEEKKLNLKPFDIQKAKEGKPVCTRDGKKARILCYDLKRAEYPIVAAIEPRDRFAESVLSYDKNGRFEHNTENNNDLMMLPEKKEGWINIYKGDDKRVAITSNIYTTQEEALDKANEVLEATYVTTNKIEWEE